MACKSPWNYRLYQCMARLTYRIAILCQKSCLLSNLVWCSWGLRFKSVYGQSIQGTGFMIMLHSLLPSAVLHCWPTLSSSSLAGLSMLQQQQRVTVSYVALKTS
jgi:hypothetical protein